MHSAREGVNSRSVTAAVPDSSVRFLHTSDWQLGMTRAYLPPASQARYRDDQIGAVRKLAAVAKEQGCHFVVVAGDVFDSLQVERQLLSRTVEALADFTVPVYLLPGNHDADNPSAIWARSETQLPPLVHVLHRRDPLPVPDVNVEIIAAPWPSRRPDTDLLAQALAELTPAEAGAFRVAVGHGVVDSLSPDPSNPAQISLANLERSLSLGVVHYVALGDRHSVTDVSDRIWYSGAPVATDFDEVRPNEALVVELGPQKIAVAPVAIGNWHFLRHEFDLSDAESVGLVSAFLKGLSEKDRTVVRLAIRGTVSLTTNGQLEEALDGAHDLLASLTISPGRSQLLVVPDGADLRQMDLSGFAALAVEELGQRAVNPGDDAETARDALMLLRRLAAQSQK